MKTILTPIDFSSVSDAVVAEAAILAKAVGGKVILLTIIQPPVLVAEYAPLMNDLAELTATGEKNAERQLARIEARLSADDIASEALQLVGAPITRIVEKAEEFKADYIVMGSHGHTALYDLLVGSTTHGVLQRARCPVVIVPSTKRAVVIEERDPVAKPALA
jgi:nucleotide-binding universal stress UspA family protein